MGEWEGCGGREKAEGKDAPRQSKPLLRREKGVELESRRKAFITYKARNARKGKIRLAGGKGISKGKKKRRKAGRRLQWWTCGRRKGGQLPDRPP
ncbi:hypothetical protein J437_LFUL004947 [Ladona fulva]|uniref:Uncharacterized protein n=1 Tax=Ladona fulva TaxID=123851 RepID=A0A8K0KQB8_LADFU|nr:hypothetical protein J437_LFUL004947 [Ladona fulva]